MPTGTFAQQKVDHPRPRPALHELREARTELKTSKDVWPPGYRERALQSINGAIESVRTILEVKDVDSFHGVGRNPDYYQRYPDHSLLGATLQDLRQTREGLRTATADFKGLKGQAQDDIDIAVGDILILIRQGKR